MSEPDRNPSLKSERTRLRRAHKKGVYDRETLYALLDDFPLCHVGYIENGVPYVTPTLQWREADRVYWHGSSKSRAILSAAGQPVCLTATRLDGLVLARSGFEHSVNHVSAMIFGTPAIIKDPDQKRSHLKRMFDHLYPGRWEQLRPMSEAELKATAVIGMDITEASVKLRSGPSDEPDKDRSWPVWGGTIPISTTTAQAVPDASNQVPLPDYLKQFSFCRAFETERRANGQTAD